MNGTRLEAQIKAWTPAVPFKLKDNIVSSDYANARPFVPAYEKESPCIEQLIANEYQRMWWEELRSWQKKTAPKPATKKTLRRTVSKKKSSRANFNTNAAISNGNKK